MWSPDPDFFVPFLIFAIPIIAIIGGITAGIVRTLGQQRLMEMAARERLAAIERGVDPSKLPPLPWADPNVMGAYGWRSLHPKAWALRLTIGGIIVLATGIGIAAFLYFIGAGENVWAVGLIPALVGVGLLISAFIVRASGSANGGTTGQTG